MTTPVVLSGELVTYSCETLSITGELMISMLITACCEGNAASLVTSLTQEME